jgi:hypothetical protein
MSNPTRKDLGLTIVLLASTGLTLSISADAMAQLRAVQPGQEFATFRQAVLDGKVELLSADPAVRDVDEKLQDFSDTFNQRWGDMGGRT